MKKLLGSMVVMMATVAILGIASRPAGVGAEEPNPRPKLNNVPVRLCIESSRDIDNVYCGINEVVATQDSITRVYPLYGGGQITLPGTFQFTSSQLNQGPGARRAVVFGPISGTYEGYGSAWIWGSLWKDGIVGGSNFLTGIPTEIFQTNLHTPGSGLDTSFTSEYALEFAFQPLALFNTYSYYVALYLDDSLGGLYNPGIGTPSTVDGQVWGWDMGPW